MNAPAIFLDRDGTIIREANYLADPERVELLPGAAEGIRRLAAAGFRIVVVSNQSGVARGYFTEVEVLKVNLRLRELLAGEAAKLDGIYWCPHLPDGSQPEYAKDCDCRKPGTGLLTKAVKDLHLDLAGSWAIGDKASDVECGKRLGLRTILVLTGYGEKTRAAGFSPGGQPDHVVQNLGEAANTILAASHRP
jgi:D-glycero-D-manno-heptose 1,7-bisphosphate phosphatase